MKPEVPAKQTPSMDEVLLEFSFAKEVPDAALLDEYLDRFPLYAVELKHLAVQLALRAEAEPKPLAEERWPAAGQKSPAVSRAMRRVEEGLLALREAMGQSAEANEAAGLAANLFARLSREELREFGRHLGANTLFVTRLRDRLIQASTISVGFIQRVADLLDTTSEKVAAHFAAPPMMPTQTSYKADQKPQTGAQQSFADAVRASNLTKEQQDSLLML